MATYSGQGIEIGHLLANADMDSNQYKFVTTGSTTGEFKLGTGGSSPVPLGVLQDDPRAGEPGRIRLLGTTKVSACSGAAAIGYGDFVSCASHGMAHREASASAAVQGIALDSLGANSAGIIEIVLLPNGLGNADNAP